MSFFDTTKKIYSEDFRKALRRIPELSDKERIYVEGVFEEELRGGLSKFELEEQCKRLKHKSGDPLEPYEVKKIKEKLLKYFE